MDMALNYLSYRARSVREMENYLDEKQFGEVEVYDTIERLKELGLLNDEQFAKDFIDSRLASKAVSKRHLAEQLYSHFIPKDIIDSVLCRVDDSLELENATEIAIKYLRQLNALSYRERVNKVKQRMQRRGYDWDTITQAITLALGDDEDSFTEEPFDNTNADLDF